MHIFHYNANGIFFLYYRSLYPAKTSRLSKKSGCDVPHISFLELVIFPIISVNIDVVKCFHYSINVETHVNESVNQIFVVALVSSYSLAEILNIEEGCLAGASVVVILPSTLR